MFPSDVRSLAPTKAPHEESKKENKDKKSNTSRKLAGSEYKETFQPTPVMFPTAVRSQAPTKAPHEEKEIKVVSRKLVDTIGKRNYYFLYIFEILINQSINQ